MQDVVGVWVIPTEDRAEMCVGIRGVGPKYNAVWAKLQSFPCDHFTAHWMDFPWSGFTTKYEYIILEIGKIVGTENMDFQ